MNLLIKHDLWSELSTLSPVAAQADHRDWEDSLGNHPPCDPAMRRREDHQLLVSFGGRSIAGSPINMLVVGDSPHQPVLTTMKDDKYGRLRTITGSPSLITTTHHSLLIANH